MSLKGNAMIGQSGGPSIVINASLVGAMEAARDIEEIETFYGALHGMEGVLHEQFIDLFREDHELVEQIRYTPSSALGTSRLKPTEADLERCMEVFKAHSIRYFFYIGGDDSQSACHQLSELAKGSDWDMNIIGIPKTVDNDLVITDNCPGYGSAARLAASAVQFVARDAEAFGNCEVLEIMGRNAGWLTGATQVGRQEDRDGPHLVYLPEVTVDPDKFLADCHEQFDKWGYLVIAVSEGFAFAKSDVPTTSAKVDEFGHARLGGVAQALSEMVEEELGVRSRFDKLGNLQRCFAYAASQVDLEEAYAVGENAVKRAYGGESDVMITIQRKSNEPFVFECEDTSLMSVAGEIKVVPAEWINEEQNGITEEFVEYAQPLMQGRSEPPPEAIPHYPRFQKHMIERKLEEYIRK